jgi:citrate lyase subunit beta/citryl-CoA lyase
MPLNRRSWLFVPGADESAHLRAARSGADVVVLELEDFTPPELRPKARALSEQALERWRGAGAVAAVRINPLGSGGRDDLAGVIAARPDLILMSKVETPEQVKALEAATGSAVDLVPNIETAAGLVNTYAIGKASKRIVAMLVASEDMVADLGTVRTRSGAELSYVRARFLVECRAAGVEAIDCPYTFSDLKGLMADARYAKALGYRMKSLVDPAHAKAVNAVFSASRAELTKAAKRLLESAGQSSPPRRKKRG